MGDTRLLTASHLDLSQKVSDFWSATTPNPSDISNTFSQSERTAALQHLKPGKALGPDSICPELKIHAGAVLNSWLLDFLSSCLHQLKIPKIWRRVVVIPKLMKPTAPKRAGWVSMQEVNHRSSCSGDPEH